MTQEQFKSKTKTWINHKLILANTSNWYKAPFKKDAVTHIRAIFTLFIKFPKNYNAAQIAILVKKHETLLEAVLPIPNNPSYENSLVLLKTLITEAENIIKTLNIQL